jgi:drug/metabolite transporter (DMT)-like permease
VASFRWLAAWVVALMTIFTPLYVMLLAGGLAGGGRLRNLVVVTLAICGAGLVTAQGARADAVWPGILLLQGANICFAVGQVRFGGLKRRWGVPDAGLVAWMYAGAAAVTVAALPVAAALGDHPFAGWSIRALLVLLYLGALPTALGFYLWNRGAARTRPAFLAAANNLKVPLAVVVSWLVFGEEVAGGRALLGLMLLVGALLVAGDPTSRRQV